MRYIILSLAIIASFSVSYGQAISQQDYVNLNPITTSMPFLAINPDSRSGAMGDAGTTLSANSSSIYWNTAMLNFAEDDAEIGLSYVPWLRQLTNDMSLSYLSGYKRINERNAIAGSLRYFSLGEITYTDNSGNVLRDDKPSEFEIALGYAFKLSKKQSIGVNGKFAYSNLTGGIVVPGAGQSKAGIAGIADLSYVLRNDEARWFDRRGVYTFGVTINNIGNKIAYSDLSRRDFLPANIKIGSSYTVEIDDYNKFTYSLEFQKLLVPTPPLYAQDANGAYYIAAGRSNDVGVIAGAVQSFYDAPGFVMYDASNQKEMNPDGSYKIEKGSKFKEEMREINIATGFEYWYNNLFALRGGYFYEDPTKGGRQFFTAGIGLQYNMFGIDISYLAPLKRNNPLANTLRFTLRLKLGQKKTNDNNDAPE